MYLEFAESLKDHCCSLDADDDLQIRPPNREELVDLVGGGMHQQGTQQQLSYMRTKGGPKEAGTPKGVGGGGGGGVGSSDERTNDPVSMGAVEWVIGS